MKIPSEVVIKARSLRMGNGVSVPAILFVCGACGRVLKPGEGSRVCPDCGSRDIETRVDPSRSVVVNVLVEDRTFRRSGGNTAKSSAALMVVRYVSCILSP